MNLSEAASLITLQLPMMRLSLIYFLESGDKFETCPTGRKTINNHHIGVIVAVAY
jgi:hypothetical protein